MLIGYAASQLINFVVQVGIVRHLTKDEFGAYAWALAAVLLVQSVIPLGLDRASARFLAKYDENADRPRLLGMLALEVAVVTGMGAIVIGGTYVLAQPLETIAPSDTAVRLLVVMIALAPIQALDILIVEMFAVFSSAWAVFLRRYVLEPLLRLGVVVLLVVMNGDVYFLTVGFVIVGGLGLTLYSFLLYRLFKRLGLTTNVSWRTIRLPWREVAGFCAPILITSFVAVATTEFAAVITGNTGGASEVASFRAVLPIAVLNLGVLYSFTTLFAPSASRLLARNAHDELRDLYWRNAIWVSVLTFPVLATTTALADQLTVFALGQRYESSAAVLVILSIGFYINAAWGFNGYTIQLLGRTSWVLITNVLTLLVMVVATLILAPAHGAVGGATAVLITLVVHNCLKQLGLGFGQQIGVVNREHITVLVHVAVGVITLCAIDELLELSLWSGLALAAVIWLGILRTTRESLRLQDIFPEVGRIRILRIPLGIRDAEVASGPAAELPPTCGPVPLRFWRLIDWRFLLSGQLGSVAYRGPVSAAETRVLTESGVTVVDGFDVGETRVYPSVDVVITTLPVASRVGQDLSAVRAGGWYVVRLGSIRTGPVARIGSASLRRWNKRLTACGCQSVVAYWHAPDERRCSYIVDIGDKVAVDAMLRRYHGVRFGRAKSIVTRLLNRLGLTPLIAKDVTLVGRMGPIDERAESEHPGVFRGTGAVRHLMKNRHSAPSTLLMTPWFEASRHVVALYFDRATKSLKAVAKVPRRPWDTSGILGEARALKLLDRDAGPAMAGRHASLLTLTGGNRPLLIQSAVAGAPVDPGRVRADPVRLTEAGFELVHEIAMSGGESPDADWFQRLIEEPLSTFREVVRLPYVPSLVDETIASLSRLRTASLPLVFEHGDLGHPNLTLHEGRMAAIDWERFEPAGLPGHDLVFFLQYVAEAAAGATTRHGQLAAFESTFVGADASAGPLLLRYSEQLGIDPSLWPELIVASWARTAASLVDRLAPHQAAGDTGAARPAAGSDIGRAALADVISVDRDFALWQYAVGRFSSVSVGGA